MAKKLKNIGLSANDKITLISNLSTMLAAGIPILESVDSLLDGSKGGQKVILETLKDDLVQGKRIYLSLEQFPKAFDKVNINIIRASEEAGTLSETLKDMIITIKKEIEFNDKIRGALIYPMFILVVFIGVLLMILIVVVPKISTVFSRLNVPLPLPTKILIFMSNTLVNNTIPTVVITVSVIAGIIIIFKRQKRQVMRLFYSLPYVSQLAREIDLTRFTRSLYLLLNAGIPITNALELTEDIVIKKDVAKAITHAKESVIAGKKLSEGFKDYKQVFPNIVLKITEAGEKSGSLDKSMQEASDYLDYQVSNSIKLVTALIEPIMLVGVGGMVGGMMLAIIAPIYGLIGQVGGGH
jgi:type II secretory pathway component PulF